MGAPAQPSADQIEALRRASRLEPIAVRRVEADGAGDSSSRTLLPRQAVMLLILSW